LDKKKISIRSLLGGGDGGRGANFAEGVPRITQNRRKEYPSGGARHLAVLEESGRG